VYIFLSFQAFLLLPPFPTPIPTPAGDEFARKMTLLLQGSGDDTGGRKKGGRKEGGGRILRGGSIEGQRFRALVLCAAITPFIYALDCQAL
jgi:hypothetical protein